MRHVEIRKADHSDLDAVEKVYSDVHDAEEGGRITTGWIRSIYPIRETAEAALERDDLFVLTEDGDVVGTAIINQIQVDVYNGAPWENETDDSDVCVLHTLAVSPLAGGKGYGKTFIRFYEEYAAEVTAIKSVTGKTILLNGSMRCISGNSAKLACKLSEQLGWRTEIVDLKAYLDDLYGLIGKLENADTIVLCIPLYVDGLPSQVIRLMEAMEAYRGKTKQIYVLANMGLYESRQLVNLFSAVRQWCGIMCYEYCGGLGISAGELLGTLMDAIPFRVGPTRRAAEGMNKLAEAVRNGRAIEDIYAEPYMFPRLLYIQIANTNWNRTAKRNGISPDDLYRRL